MERTCCNCGIVMGPTNAMTLARDLPASLDWFSEHPGELPLPHEMWPREFCPCCSMFFNAFLRYTKCISKELREEIILSLPEERSDHPWPEFVAAAHERRM